MRTARTRNCCRIPNYFTGYGSALRKWKSKIVRSKALRRPYLAAKVWSAVALIKSQKSSLQYHRLHHWHHIIKTIMEIIVNRHIRPHGHREHHRNDCHDRVIIRFLYSRLGTGTGTDSSRSVFNHLNISWKRHTVDADSIKWYFQRVSYLEVLLGYVEALVCCTQGSTRCNRKEHQPCFRRNFGFLRLHFFM